MAGTKTLKITGGTIIYDEDDESIVASRTWHVNDGGYAVWRGDINGKKKTIRLHRLINKTPDHLVTDHINRNPLDNRKFNLRSCTQKVNAQNGAGRWGQRVYFDLPQGITFDKTRAKYMAKKPRQKRFDTLEAAIAFRGVGL